MKKLSYLLLLLLPLVYACNSKTDVTGMDMEEELETCTEGTNAQRVDCRIGDTEWIVRSVTSNIPRPLAGGGETTEWTDFSLSCRDEAVFKLYRLAPLPSDSIVAFPETRYLTSECTAQMNGRFTDEGPLVVGSDFRDGEFSYTSRHSEMFYGIELEAESAAQTDYWYDISFERDEFFRFTVNKSYEGVDYVVDVDLEPYRE